MDQLEKIKHLYWRAGMGLSPEEWMKARQRSLGQARLELFRQAGEVEWFQPVNALFVSKTEKAGMSDKEKKKLKRFRKMLGHRLKAEWLERMTAPEVNHLLERMTLFWHGHFACQIKVAHFAVNYLNTLQRHALGNFRDLLLGVAKDAAMIRFLNNQQNRKQQPNENFARELMELFTIGRGNYSETDVKEAARAFTGWTSDFRGAFLFKKQWHDYGRKTFMGRSGNFDGMDIIDRLLEKRETARFLSGKIYRYFVNEIPHAGHIEELTSSLYDSGYDIGFTMKTLLESEWFYDPRNVGIKIKSPVDLLAGVIRTFQVKFEDPKVLLFLQRILGQVLLNPPNVAGWPGGRSWIDNATLMLRLNLVKYLFLSVDLNIRTKDEPESMHRSPGLKRLKASANEQRLIRAFSSFSKEALPGQLQAFLINSRQPVDMDTVVRFSSSPGKSEHLKLLALRLMSLPEYQLC